MVSSWFRRRIVALGVFAAVIVFAAVCVSFGAVGLGSGVVVLFGVAALVRQQRRRRMSGLGQIPDGPDALPR
jgi:O-antigen ligase